MYARPDGDSPLPLYPEHRPLRPNPHLPLCQAATDQTHRCATNPLTDRGLDNTEHGTLRRPSLPGSNHHRPDKETRGRSVLPAISCKATVPHHRPRMVATTAPSNLITSCGSDLLPEQLLSDGDASDAMRAYLF